MLIFQGVSQEVSRITKEVTLKNVNVFLLEGKILL